MSGKGVGGKRFRAKVMSIKPEYAKLIYAGKKNWEFRKKAPVPYQAFYVYESAPVCAITGFVCFGVQVTGASSVVWDLVTHNRTYPFTRNKPGIKFADFMGYTGDSYVTALRVIDYGKVGNIKLIGRPPQNYGECEIVKEGVAQ